MASKTHLHENEEFLAELKECAKLLVEKLQGDQYEEASQVIHTITEARDRHIFHSVGRLTRGLHDSIVNFNVDGDLSTEPAEIKNSEIQDASNRLNYVIDLTQKAAEKTMDMVDESAPIATNLGQEAGALRDEWARLKRREMSPDEFRDLYQRMDDFLAQMVTGTERLGRNMQEIVLEQGFQDLTGQVLKRVIGLINDVEQDLVSLVRMAAQVEDLTGLSFDEEAGSKANNESTSATRNASGEGPQIDAKNKPDVVSSQDEVDDLLSSLGF